VSREFERAKARDNQAWTEATIASSNNLKDHINCNYSVSIWSNATRQAYAQQWCPHPRRCEWDWDNIESRYRPPKERVCAVLAGDRLAALALITATRARVKVNFLEGDPRLDCPMQGQRALVVLDLAATYGQRLGCEEIHLVPVNDTLLTLYCGTYGFEEVLVKGSTEYLRRGLT
jgi:hypothetical protein